MHNLKTKKQPLRTFCTFPCSVFPLYLKNHSWNIFMYITLFFIYNNLSFLYSSSMFLNILLWVFANTHKVKRIKKWNSMYPLPGFNTYQHTANADLAFSKAPPSLPPHSTWDHNKTNLSIKYYKLICMSITISLPYWKH